MKVIRQTSILLDVQDPSSQTRVIFDKQQNALYRFRKIFWVLSLRRPIVALPQIREIKIFRKFKEAKVGKYEAHYIHQVVLRVHDRTYIKLFSPTYSLEEHPFHPQQMEWVDSLYDFLNLSSISVSHTQDEPRKIRYVGRYLPRVQESSLQKA